MSDIQENTTEAKNPEAIEREKTAFEKHTIAVLKVTEIQARILDAFRLAKEQGGLTDYELGEVVGSQGSSHRSARAILARRGLVVDSGQTRPVRGKPRPVWTLGRLG